jgi:hypothetical protein
MSASRSVTVFLVEFLIPLPERREQLLGLLFRPPLLNSVSSAFRCSVIFFPASELGSIEKFEGAFHS